MNKRYMDFVPVNGEKPVKKQASRPSPRPAVIQRMPRSSVVAKETVARPLAARKVVRKPAVSVVSKPQKKVYRELPKEKPATKSAFSLKDTPQFGVIEDLNPKFVKTEVPKRPLSSGNISSTPKAEAKALKAKKIGGRRAKKAVEKPVEKQDEVSMKTAEAQTFKTPHSPFINQEKVAKRPLSKNVYQKKIEPTKEKESGPITIISKPEKESHVGLVIAIILTVVLGAAAGTVAYLLLPK